MCKIFFFVRVCVWGWGGVKVGSTFGKMRSPVSRVPWIYHSGSFVSNGNKFSYFSGGGGCFLKQFCKEKYQLF